MLRMKSSEAKTRFDELMQAALAGETVTIELENGQRVKLVAEAESNVLRQPGTGKGLFTMAPDFDAPLEDVEDLIYGSDS